MVKLHQQWETPAAVVEFVRRTWAPDFDAMATPFSAIGPAPSSTTCCVVTVRTDDEHCVRVEQLSSCCQMSSAPLSRFR